MLNRRRNWDYLRNGLAVVLSILFVWSSLGALYLCGAGQQLLRPDLYKRALADQDIYARMPQLVAQQLDYSLTGEMAGGGKASGQDSDGAFISGIAGAASPVLTACLQTSLGSAYGSLAAGTGRPTTSEVGRVKACLRADGVPAGVAAFHKGMPVFFWLLLEKDWESILASILPEEWLRSQSESVIDQIYAKLQTDDPTPPIRISLADLKARLRGVYGLNAVVGIIDAQPPCTLDQLAPLLGLVDPAVPLTGIALCRPPDVVLSAIRPNIQAAVAMLADQAPDWINFEDPSASASTSGPYGAARLGMSALRTATMVAILIPILLLGVVVMCGAWSIRRLLFWLGLPIMAAGSLGVVSAAFMVLGLSVAAARPSNDGPESPKVAPGVLEAGAQVVAAVGRGYLAAVAADAMVITLVGAGLVIAAIVVGGVKGQRPAAVRCPDWAPPHPTAAPTPPIQSPQAGRESPES